MAAAATAILAAGAFIGSGYLHTRRVEHKAQRERAAVHAMTQQELAAAIARCDAMPAADTPHDAAAGRDAGQQRDSTERRDAAYCEEAAREMDDRCPRRCLPGRCLPRRCRRHRGSPESETLRPV
jgi:hypothetical protein